ncbi:hypothetical protein NEIMUCOT_03751 [Neisseria mucosa ATCC 25996]|uniref:Uncharacterized protein n=1 Tax=Neisseria mucosa (strain ATCC 25996 / DSM 4631 / NCTC 10774 / M26) TaxID=546266 RepID=D2ZT18_NEIM2|nr:hypothetical protein NEIMUCOT_03751 [Neisseria mucosa ATCC 25996]
MHFTYFFICVKCKFNFWTEIFMGTTKKEKAPHFAGLSVSVLG